MPDTYVVKVGPSEAVAVNLPPGSVIMADRLGCPPAFEHAGADPWPVVAVIWGTGFGGAWICSYGSADRIRYGHHKRDRAVWQQASKLIRNGGIARIGHSRQSQNGKQVWTATSVRLVTDESEAIR